MYAINVTNNTASKQNFFVFQAPAVYAGGPTVYSNSVYQQTVGPSAAGGGVMQCLINLQYYAGAQQQTAPPAVGHVSGGITTIQAVNLTPATGVPTSNATQMSVDPLMLSPPYADNTVQTGAFRILTPIYTPGPDGNYNIGSAVQSPVAGAPAIMSNFVVAQPNDTLDCQPVLVFYVATGNFTAGTVINFTSASRGSATCDATTGYQTFGVSYNANGTWTVTNS